MLGEIIRRIQLLTNTRSNKALKIGREVEFINTGTITAVNAYLGYIENKSVKLANKSRRSYLINSGTIELGNNVRVHKGFGIEVTGELSIGDNSYINPDAIVVCRHKITIGQNCSISWNVTIMDDDLHQISGQKQQHAIQIGDNVWIGANTFIAKGVVIGSGSVIAAGTVVTKDVPPHVLYGGNPGRVIREQIEWE